MTHLQKRQTAIEFDEIAANFGPVIGTASDLQETQDLDGIRIAITSASEDRTIWIEDQIDRYVATKKIVRSPAHSGEILGRVIAGWQNPNSTLHVLVDVHGRISLLKVLTSKPPSIGSIRRFGAESPNGRCLFTIDQTSDMDRIIGIVKKIISHTKEIINSTRLNSQQKKNEHK